jgi:acetylornithine deacetylase/succinyl-diaminopimelate desuccinylase-like protein
VYPPNVPLLPFATDGAFLTPAGIPTYGLCGMFLDPDGNGIHGRNERIRVSSVYKGRDFLYEVVRVYSNQE